MKNPTLIMIALMFNVLTVSAQNGDTIQNAIPVDGSDTNVNVLDYNNATYSGLSPACETTEDVFYKHVTTTGHNKMTIGMSSAGLSLLTEVNYQIFIAPNNDLNNLQLVQCGDYPVLVLLGGEFEYIIEDVEEANTYYLRVYKTSGLGGSLTDLLNGTSITMESKYDATLSVDNESLDEFKYVVNQEEIKLLNNTAFNQFNIYSIDGKKVLSDKDNQVLETIDISVLNDGIYVVNLESNSENKIFKFFKQ